VELGDFPNSSTALIAPPSREYPALRADLAAPDLGDGVEAAKAGRLPTPSSMPSCAGCCTRRWMPARAAGRRNGMLPTGLGGGSATMTARDGRTGGTHARRDLSQLARVLSERNDGIVQMLRSPRQRARPRLLRGR